MTRLTISRSFPVDLETMWSLWTDPEHLGRWFRPSATAFGPTHAALDLRLGGTVRFEMITVAGAVHAVSGRVVELEPPHRLSFTWRWDGEHPDTLVELTFSLIDDATSVTIEHTRLIDAADAGRHREGWSGMLETLAADIEP